jgi:hypothetical protein
LIGALSAVVDAIAGAEQCLALAGKSMRLHCEASRVAADDGDARLAQTLSPAKNRSEDS